MRKIKTIVMMIVLMAAVMASVSAQSWWVVKADSLNYACYTEMTMNNGVIIKDLRACVGGEELAVIEAYDSDGKFDSGFSAFLNARKEPRPATSPDLKLMTSDGSMRNLTYAEAMEMIAEKFNRMKGLLK